MFLQLNHKNLDVYGAASDLLFECYHLVSSFPPEERYNLVSQIKRAALSVKLNIAEGASRKSSSERKRFFEIARGAVIALDAALEVSVHLDYLNTEDLETFNILLNRCFGMLTKISG